MRLQSAAVKQAEGLHCKHFEAMGFKQQQALRLVRAVIPSLTSLSSKPITQTCRGFLAPAQGIRCRPAQQSAIPALSSKLTEPPREPPTFTTAMDKLQAALSWELHHQYSNTKGQQHSFNAFAASQFLQLEQQLAMPLQKSTCLKLAKGFQTYNQLNLYQRADLVRSASGCLSSWKPSSAVQPHSTTVTPPTSSTRHTVVTPTAQSRRQSHQSALRSTSNTAAVSPPAAASSQPRPASAWAQQSTDVQPAKRSANDTSLQAPISNAGQNGHIVTTSECSVGSYTQAPRKVKAQLSDLAPSTNCVKAFGEEPAMEVAQTDAVPASEVTQSTLASSTDSYSDSSVFASSDVSVDVENSTDAAVQDAMQSQSALPNTALSQSAADSSSDVSASNDVSLTAQLDETDATDASGAPAAKTVVSPEKLALQASFALSAAAAAEAAEKTTNFEAGGQRSAAWFDLRQGRLTASAFANAIGLFSGGREALWEEKLGLAPRFAGNAATKWGNNRESDALSRYAELTGQSIEQCSFKVLKDDLVHGWLGASPDGLLQSLGLQQAQRATVPGVGSGIILGDGPGVLEIKCPFNRGEPLTAAPPKRPQWYYMPQVQGLMDIFDRDWCNLYVWTANGSSLFHIPRDKEYWRLCFSALAEFWWSHVVPAKHILAQSNPDPAAVQLYRPAMEHALAAQIRQLSKDMAVAAPSTSFPPGNRAPASQSLQVGE